MELKEHYNQLYSHSIQQIHSDAYQTDDLIDSDQDKRLGITLILRSGNVVKANIQKFLSEIKLIEPQQYFYPNSDMHVTVMSIISCYNGFDLKQINVQDYIDVIQESINELNKFNIQFKGLTASPSCLLVQGFFENNSLNQLRDDLRVRFKQTSLEQTIDKRYAIQTAHSTIFRLKSKLNNKNEFLKKVNEYRDFNFGTFEVSTLELVYNDWYQRSKNVKLLHSFKLK